MAAPGAGGLERGGGSAGRRGVAAIATTIDPVQSPQAYTEMILGLLGDDDPGEVQSGTAQVLREMVLEVGDRLRARPAAEEWSALELLGHILDSEIVATARYRWVIAEESPPLPGYDQDLWVRGLGYQGADAAELLDLFQALRSANLRLWLRSTPEHRARAGIHSERGPQSLELLFKLIAGHDRFHTDQMRRAIAAVRGS